VEVFVTRFSSPFSFHSDILLPPLLMSPERWSIQWLQHVIAFNPVELRALKERIQLYWDEGNEGRNSMHHPTYEVISLPPHVTGHTFWLDKVTTTTETKTRRWPWRYIVKFYGCSQRPHSGVDPWHTVGSRSEPTLMESFLKPHETSRGVTPGQMASWPTRRRGVGQSSSWARNLSLLFLFKVINWRRTRQAGAVARVAEKRNVNRILVRTPYRKNVL
jgi:hypothetical protein